MDAVLISLSCICNHSSHVYHTWGALAENIISQLFCLFGLGGSLCILGTDYIIFCQFNIQGKTYNLELLVMDYTQKTLG